MSKAWIFQGKPEIWDVRAGVNQFETMNWGVDNVFSPRRTVTIFGALTATLIVIGTPVAGPWDDGVAAIQRGDYATALPIWHRLADQGDLRAVVYLGYMYQNGWGVPQDYVAAVSWFRRAAELGDTNGQNSLGLAYAEGRGVAQDYTVAVSWLRRAAEHGDAVAQNNLGWMYFYGYGVPQDFVNAHMWINLGAANGDPEHLKSRNFVAERMTPAQIAEAQRLAREWKPKRER